MSRHRRPRPSPRGRAATAAVCAAVLAGLGTAPADAVDAPVIRGAAQPDEAPLLEPGTHLDTVRERERAWYAVAAEPGQAVHARVELTPLGDADKAVVATLAVIDTSRQPLGSDEARIHQPDGPVALEVASQPLPAVADGPALVSLAVQPTRADPATPASRPGVAPPAAFDVDMHLDVTGAAISPSLTPSPPPAEPAPDRQEETAAADDDAADRRPPSLSLGDLLPVALVAFTAGAVVGFEGWRTRRRRRGA